jgi:hypothetical protein
MRAGRHDIDVWWILGGVFMGLAVLFAFGEWRGWWHELGEIATALSFGLGVLSFATAATQRTVRRMDTHIDVRLMALERAFSGRVLGTPKSKESIRQVDLSPRLAEVLRRHLTERSARCLAKDWTAPWLFLTEAGTPFTKQNVQRAMDRFCRRAGLGHWSPHDLRHTYASLLLQNGENPKYVQQQLGHATLSLTTDLYGKWLRARPTHGGAASLDPATERPQTPGLRAVQGTGIASDSGRFGPTDAQSRSRGGAGRLDGAPAPLISRPR